MKPDQVTSKDRVEHVLNAINLIQTFSAGYTPQSFEKDIKTNSACLYQFTIIAQASSHIESNILDRHPYPWYKIRAFRNFILHEYHGITMRVIWDTIQHVIPELKSHFEKIQAAEFK